MLNINLKNNMFHIYIIRNNINNKVYVGKSNNPKIRWKHHRKIANGGKEKYPNDFFSIHGALSKYGFDKFEFKIIESFENENDCLNAEVKYIEEYKSLDRKCGYNLQPGGDGSSPTMETRLKMSLAQTGEKHSQAILTEVNVIQILNKYINEPKATCAKLAKEYGVSSITVNDILKHRTWKYISETYPKFRKTHSNSGNACGHNKLTEKDVIEVIKLHNTGEYTYKKIALMFKVDPGTIGAIIKCKNWKHIDREIK